MCDALAGGLIPASPSTKAKCERFKKPGSLVPFEMVRKVLMSKGMESKLESLAHLDEEISGVLLYRQYGDFCAVEGIFLTGGGDAGSVEPEKERVEVLNEFLRMNPEYRFVEFHTHSKGTLKAYGDQYARSFSFGDIRAIQGQIERDSQYMHLLVTPETQILYGADSPVLASEAPMPNNDRMEQLVSEALTITATRLGYGIVA